MTKCGENRRNFRSERTAPGSVLTGGEDHWALGHDGHQESKEGSNKHNPVHFLVLSQQWIRNCQNSSPDRSLIGSRDHEDREGRTTGEGRT